jgi:type II secretion system protein J
MRVLTPRAGFTLLEMLVALVLMAILAAGLYMSLHIGFDARARAERILAAPHSASVAMEIIRRDVACALPPTGVLAGTFLGTDAQAETSPADADTLAFHCMAQDAARGAPVTHRHEYALAAIENEELTGLVCRVRSNLLAPTEQEPVEEVICRRVTALNLRYYDGVEWVDSWDSTTRENALPMAIEVSMMLRPEPVRGVEPAGYVVTRVLRMPCTTLKAGGEVTSVPETSGGPRR